MTRQLRLSPLAPALLREQRAFRLCSWHHRRDSGSDRWDAAQSPGVGGVGDPAATLAVAVPVAAEVVDQLTVLRPQPLIAAATGERRHPRSISQTRWFSPV